MIIKLETKMTITDDDGNVIKVQDYGRAYLSDIDFQRAAKDRWRVIFHNTANKKKKKQSEETSELCKIVDSLIVPLRATILDRFLCRSDEVWEEHKEEKKLESS